MAEIDLQHASDLAVDLALTSQMLLVSMPEGFTYHLKGLKFNKPNIQLGRHDISPLLARLAEGTQELFVSSHLMHGEWDGDDYSPPNYVWEMSPPSSWSFIGRFTSECYPLDVNKKGLGVSLYCPELEATPSREETEFFLDYGALNPDLLFWSEEGETWYDRTKPESIVLDVIERRHKIVGLEIGLWMLQSLQNAEDIHPEKWCFEL